MGNIIKLSDAASIAIHSMIVLAINPDKVISNKEIASALNVSDDHLSKVLQRLHKAGFVESIRGPKGGFKLTNSPDRINLHMIYEAIEGEMSIHSCLFSSPVCNLKDCLFNNVFCKMRKDIKDYFENTKLSELVTNKKELIEVLEKSINK